MRIVSGKYRHRLISYPNTNLTRPTMDRVREALMSAIGTNIYNKDVLDLFAGSGALGLESLSRGAKSCYFIDNNIDAINVINENIKKLNVNEETHVIYSSYKDFLLKHVDLKFSLVFLDPPYKNKDVYDEIISFMKENNMLSENVIMVLESDEELGTKEDFKTYRHYRYGTVHVNIYWR